jgi:hypothetical protein
MKSENVEEKLRRFYDVHRSCIRPSADLDIKVLADIRKARKESSMARQSKPNVWRKIMESKITRYSAAAVVILAVALVLLTPFGTSKNGGIIWAKVVDKVHQMPTAIHKEKCVFWKMGQHEPLLEADVMMYASDEYGWVEHVYDEKETLLARVYFLKETQEFIIISPTEKKYGKLSLPLDWLDQMTGMLTPYGLVDFFTSSHYTELGRAKFENFDVEGFEITENTDPNTLPIPEPIRLLFPAKDMVVRLWIDVETSLPVGFDFEFNTDRGLFTGFDKLHCEFRAYDIQWNAELPEGIFEPNIPDDYTEFKITDVVPIEAKAGLVGLIAIPTGFIFWKKRRKKARANQHK